MSALPAAERGPVRVFVRDDIEVLQGKYLRIEIAGKECGECHVVGGDDGKSPVFVHFEDEAPDALGVDELDEHGWVLWYEAPEEGEAPEAMACSLIYHAAKTAGLVPEGDDSAVAERIV